jgi:hypothetical protein
MQDCDSSATDRDAWKAEVNEQMLVAANDHLVSLAAGAQPTQIPAGDLRAAKVRGCQRLGKPLQVHLLIPEFMTSDMDPLSEEPPVEMPSM